ncbi:mono [ADP-ribose] polymerase PARP16-like [Acanthaster planci]|uniref:Poly [ADP-ribose] polymerase n=1 Tax=Acanthaster planci TaxID=133434 RepID=A0A8B7ZMS6_ACAPL|nr:mono [ADP-ribose] polymerase PARP16-like [Acanthaster planci]XP_022106192.1 mono [ADP-ribose] polymerase PARP16-like [Acanthaster planci]XP_022106193.1 mono [ADP-ribose] polymerase PARP16-like [Acanthaster planci]XP_022106194.1 mono [ADP-ribose] polymerase PARP16-like [Acanthaster planci]XP_022106195.1 mono [ADP-ribose] polymerase PARP16-like [Acanthaster planci]
MDAQTTMEESISKVLAKIQSDETAADLQWSLFQSALNSYRRDSVLRPFPPTLPASTPNNQEKDYTALKSVADEVPNLRNLVQARDKSKLISEQAWRLLSWVLLQNPLTVHWHNKSKFQQIQELTGESSYQVTPSHVFEVQYSSASSQKFDELRQSRDLIYAYHGSRLDNFYSILHNGLHAHMNKNSLFGEGTYLSSDLSVSMPYSPIGTAWEGSSLGTTLSCVAVCELIDHPDVKCQTRDRSSNANDGRRRSHAPQSMGGEVPEKYYVVTNNEVVRLKYLLVFADKTKSKRSSQPRSKVMTFVCNHLFALCMLGYLIVLLLIGLLNSRTFQTFYRKHFGSRS